MERIITDPYLTDGEKFALLDNAIISTQTAINTIGEKVDKHQKILVEGNGVLPLVEQVRNINAFINSVKFWMKTIAVAVVLQTITFGGAAFVYFLKLYPILEKLQKGV